MSLVTNLNTLTTKIAAFKTKIVAALTDKYFDGLTVNNTCDEIANAIRDKKYVLSGDGRFADYINIFSFSGMTDISYLFCNSKLTELPSFDLSLCDNADYACRNMSNLVNFPSWTFTNITNASQIFYGCSKLSIIPSLSFDKVTSIEYAFSNCSGITNVGELSIPSASSLFRLFGNDTNLVKISSLDIPSCTNANSMLLNCISLQFLVIKNLGKQSAWTSLSISYSHSYGVGSTENRQSLIDTLITYSFDRKTAGYPTFTVTLSAETKALLTDTEIAQVTAKGFTIA